MKTDDELLEIAHRIYWHLEHGELKAATKVLRDLEDETAQPFRDLGTVYVRPEDWSLIKRGGPPEFKDCEEIDLSSM